MTFDIFFLSYKEPNAAENWQQLTKLFPRSRWIKDVQGEANAFRTCARESSTDHFLVVEGDNWLLDSFCPSLTQYHAPNQKLHVFRSLNPVNGLIYGFGAVKLWPKHQVLAFQDENPLDFPLAVATNGVVIEPIVASETRFNGDPFHSFRGAYREVYKLMSGQCGYAQQKPSVETKRRIEIWLTRGRENQFGAECLIGARAGAYHARQGLEGQLINDWDYMKEMFKLCLEMQHQKMVCQNLQDYLLSPIEI